MSSRREPQWASPVFQGGARTTGRRTLTTAAGFLFAISGLSTGCGFLGTDVLPTTSILAAVASPATSTVTLAASSALPGGAAVTVTLHAKDAAGANLTSGGATVGFGHTGGTSVISIGGTTDVGNGTYTAQITPTTAGTATTLSATIGGVAVTTAMPTFTVTAAAVADPTKSTVTVASATAPVGGVPILVTLQAKDATGANLTTGGATVVFGHNGGTSVITISGTIDVGNGTYTALITPVTTGTATTLSATIGGVAVTTAMPTFTVLAAFATPDIVNNADFESGFDGFTDNSGNPPSPSSGAFSISRSTDQAKTGSFSMKSTYTATGTDASIAFHSVGFSQMTVFARVWFYRTGNLPDTHHKWIRFQTGGLNGVRGGMYLSSLTGGLTWAEASNSNIDISPGIGTPTANTWHSIEVEYDRSTWNVAGKGPRVRFWYDGNVQVPGSQPGILNSTAFWGDDNGNATVAGPWLYSGTADSQAYPSGYLVFDDTYNGGNTQAGVSYYDRVAVSSLGRIGP
jgi:hypothetical protein